MTGRARAIVPEKDFYLVLKRLRDVRKWAVERDIDPWAFRQAMITVLELDTVTGVERGVKPEKLDEFDAVTRREAREFVRSLPG